MRTVHFTLSRPDEPHFCPPWGHVQNVLMSLGFNVTLHDGTWNEVVPKVDAPKPAPKATPRTRRADALLEAIVEAIPTITDAAVGDLMHDLCSRVRLYRDYEPVRQAECNTASEAPAPHPDPAPDCNTASEAPTPAPRYVLDEAELKRRLHQPAGGPYAHGKAWDIHVESPMGLGIRKALASETFKIGLAGVVAHRVEISHFEALSSVLDLLTFATTEGLI